MANNTSNASCREYTPLLRGDATAAVAVKDTLPDNTRHMSLFSGVALIVGTIIGSGIFASPGPVLTEVGSVGMSLLVWVAGGLISMVGALCYAELGTMMPESGGEFQYLMQAFGPLPAHIYAWSMVTVSNAIAIAAVAQVLARYFCQLVLSTQGAIDESQLAADSWMTRGVAAGAILLVTGINCYSRRSGSAAQNLFTTAKLSAIVLIVMIGGAWLVGGNVDNFRAPFSHSSTQIGSYGSALYFALFSYMGWTNLNLAAGELKNPRRNLPLAIVLSLSIAMACFVAANIAYFAVLPVEVVRDTTTVAMAFGLRTMGTIGSQFMAIMVVISAFGAVNGGIFASSRLAFASAGARSVLPEALSKLHPTRETPMAAVLFTGSITAFWSLVADFNQLVDVLMFVIWLTYFSTSVSLLRLRVLYPDAPRPFRVWTPLAVLFCLLAGALVTVPLFKLAAGQSSLWAYLFCLVACLIAVPIYWIRVEAPTWWRGSLPK